ncbi:MAG: hypothetical protein IJD24_05405 [Agathobacter sp.]|nr:hypothetical protein [Agathobacter sp.]
MKKIKFLLLLLLVFGLAACKKQDPSAQVDDIPIESSEGIVEDTQETEEKDISIFDFSDVNLALGCTYELSERYPMECEFEVDKPQIASVSNGILTANESGKTKVTVSFEGQEAEFMLGVTTPQLSVMEVNKIVGGTVTLNVYGTSSEVEWESDNDSIATVENGIVTAMPTGCGMSTNIHAYVDGMDLVCKVNVEPIPQLDTTYKIFSEGHIRSTIAGHYDCDLTAYSNANQVIRYTEEQMADLTAFGLRFSPTEEVMNLGKVDYSDGRTFAVYESYTASVLGEDDFTHIEVYLVGTSQEADVLAKSTHGNEMQVSYEPKEGYGVISIWLKGSGDNHAGLVYVEVDGIEYCFGVQNRGYGPTNPNFLPKSDVLIEYVEEGNVKSSNTGGYSDIMNSSYTFIPMDLSSELTEKFIDTLQDKAISTCVDLLFEIIF